MPERRERVLVGDRYLESRRSRPGLKDRSVWIVDPGGSNASGAGLLQTCPRGARVQKITRGCFGDRVGGVRPFSLAAFSLPSTADAEPPRVIPVV